jgi:hypothetical protein
MKPRLFSMKTLPTILATAFFLIAGIFHASAAPSITTQPVASRTVTKGAAVSFTVAATGAGSLTYQWQKDGVDIPSATSAGFNIASVQPQHIGYYKCKVTDSTGTTTSQQSTLNVTGEDFATWQGLVAQYGFQGSLLDSVSGVSAAALFNRAEFIMDAGLGRSVLQLYGSGSMTPTGGFAKIQIPNGSRQSYSVSFWIYEQGHSHAHGESFVFFGNESDRSSGVDLVSHCWFFNPNAVEGIYAGAIYVAPSLSPAQQTFDGVRISQPEWTHFVSVLEGGQITIYRNGVWLGTVGSDLSIESATSLFLGRHFGGWGDSARLTARFSDLRIYNRAISENESAALFSTRGPTPPALARRPVNQEIFLGQTATFRVTAIGSAPLSYQWFLNGRPIAGANTSSYSVKAAPSQCGTYSVKVSNAYGEVTSDPVTLDAKAARYNWVAGSETPQVAAGASASFEVANVTGPTDAVSYQWFKDGRAVPGATSAALRFDSVTFSNAGRYTLVITTAAGKETTAVRVLGVRDSGLLVYSYGATVTDAGSSGEATSKLMGYLLVDPGNGQGAILLYGKIGTRKVQSLEGPFPLTVTSTGPLPGSRSVFHSNESMGETSYIWLTGRDALVRLNASTSTLAPSVATGFIGRVQNGDNATVEHAAVTLALSTSQTLATRTNAESLEDAVSRIQAELTAKGYLLPVE